MYQCKALKQHAQLADFQDLRNNIQSGDLLIWSSKEKTIGNLILILIRLFTLSEYSHVGIAWRVGEHLFVIEASMPEVRIVPLYKRRNFYHLPMNLTWSSEHSNRLLNYVGCRYSIVEAVRGYLGQTNPRDDRWQCAELAVDFYKHAGIDFGLAFTPAKLVEAVILQRSPKISFIK